MNIRQGEAVAIVTVLPVVTKRRRPGSKSFVVDIQSVGHAEPTLKYLAPYVHRVAIRDKRIMAVDESSVKYSVRPSKSRHTVTRKVPGETFVRSFSQHVLPAGFMKIRHYGWMSANSKVKIDEVKWLVWLHLGGPTGWPAATLGKNNH